MSMEKPRTTSDPDAPRLALEASGWRWTSQRAAVYDHLLRAGAHPTTEEVYQSVKRDLPRISLATVYKALEVLVSSGLAARLPAGAGEASARYDARRDDHYHLRCLRSGAVLDLETPFDPALIHKLDPALTRNLQRRGFHVTGYRLELVGYYEDEPPLPASGGVDDTPRDP